MKLTSVKFWMATFWRKVLHWAGEDGGTVSRGHFLREDWLSWQLSSTMTKTAKDSTDWTVFCKILMLREFLEHFRTLTVNLAVFYEEELCIFSGLLSFHYSSSNLCCVCVCVKV